MREIEIYKVVRLVNVIEENEPMREARMSCLISISPFATEYVRGSFVYPVMTKSMLFGFTMESMADRFAAACYGPWPSTDRVFEVWKATGIVDDEFGNSERSSDVCVQSTMWQEDIRLFWNTFDGSMRSLIKVSKEVPITTSPISTIFCRAIRLDTLLSTLKGR